MSDILANVLFTKHLELLKCFTLHINIIPCDGVPIQEDQSLKLCTEKNPYRLPYIIVCIYLELTNLSFRGNCFILKQYDGCHKQKRNWISCRTTSTEFVPGLSRVLFFPLFFSNCICFCGGGLCSIYAVGIYLCIAVSNMSFISE